MKQNEPVTKIMSADLKTVHLGQQMSDVRRMLANNPFDHVPVMSGETLIGMLSSSDVMRLTFDAGNADPRSVDAVLDNRFTVEGTMTKELVTVRPSDTIRRAAELLVKSSVHCLPVLDQGKLVGIVTSTDLIRYLLDQY